MFYLMIQMDFRGRLYFEYMVQISTSNYHLLKKKFPAVWLCYEGTEPLD